MTDLTEGEAIKLIDDALSGLDQGARSRILQWANGKYLSDDSDTTAKIIRPTTVKPSRSSALPKRATEKKSVSKKQKGSFKVDKNLNLNPNGKLSAKVFATQKAASNQKQKCTVAVYYLQNELGLTEVSTSHVYTFFKELAWPVPADLPNTLAQAGSEGWLDTSSNDAILLTVRGENLVEHTLPLAKEGES